MAAAGHVIMTQTFHSRRTAPVRTAVDALVAEHGAWRVVLPALRALIAPPAARRAARLGLLDNRLRRDIGLPPLEPGPRDWQRLH